jgi:hypothetical protein
MKLRRFAALFVLAACNDTVDTERDEQRIRAGVFEQTGIEIDSVACPDHVKRKKGKVFTCTAYGDGGELAVRVTQTSDDNGARWRVSEGLVISAKLEDEIEQAFQDRLGGSFLADCGKRNRVAVPGKTFSCEIEADNGEARTITAHIDDTAGNVSWRLDKKQ